MSSFISSDGKKIFYKEWNHVKNPKAIVHIVHGMAEYIERYDHFAKFLNYNEILVYGFNTRGHGKTGQNEGKLGHFEKDGWNKIMVDIYNLMKIQTEKYPNIPLFILGHSMGSFLTRNFVHKFHPKLSGVILIGTGSADEHIVYNFTRKVANMKKQKDLAYFIHKTAFKNYNNHIKNPKTTYDWLCSDNKVVKNYIEDPLCGFWVTNGFYSEIMSGFLQLSKYERNIKLNKDLPIILLAGKNDPVGKLGKYVKNVYEKYKKQGMSKVDIILYENMRHEILNEINKELVYNDILKFINKNI